jgi:O-antigen/teichoic acid export membrane protein
MSGMVIVLSSSPYLFGDYAIRYVGKNKLNGEYLTAQQFLLITGVVILVGGLCVVIKNKPSHIVNPENRR